MKNYGDVLNQLVAYGLRVSSLEVGRLVRCKVEGDREKRGWYALHELPQTGGDSVIVGTYGVWRGDDNGLMKIELDKDSQLNKEEMAAIRQRVAADKKRAEFERKRRASQAADRAGKAWHNGTAEGHIDYLDKKNIQSHGLRYTKRGAAMVPMLDVGGLVHGVQFILDSEKHKDDIKKHGRNKHYWPTGVSKKGHFHLIGGTPVDVILLAEGYATAATLYEATGLPVAVAFDANNILPVGQALKKYYKGIKIVICADDDAFSKCLNCKKSVNVNESIDCPHCSEPHKKKNTGIEKAGLAAMQLTGYSIKPIFSDEAARFEHYNKNKGKLTDFNDLQHIEGLHTVRVQIETALTELGIRRKSAQSAGQLKQGGGENDLKLVPINSTEEIMERFVLIYGEGGIVFDRKFRIIIKLTDLADACTSREVYKRWNESPQKEMVLLEEVGFDPSELDKSIKCNMWHKWPTRPKKGNCELLLELLEYMCADCKDNGETFGWILKWLAYPIQNPGAKMRSTVVIHGPQGTGKNLFFEAVMSIYGQYGRIIDQAAIEDQFTDWISKKLFLIADEVVARSEKFHIKNKLKSLITGSTVRVNAKNKIAHEERNQVNFVFLSNEDTPVVLEEDDRRHAIVWTPAKLTREFYQDVGAEVKNGGVEALHDYLLNVPIGDFDEHTQPPMTQAKKDLINLSKDNVLRFYDDWLEGEMDGIELMPVLSETLYELYNQWCKQQGVRATSLNRMTHVFAKRPGAERKRYKYLEGTKQKQKRFIVPPRSAEKPPGSSQTAWLGDCVMRFSNAVERYKEL